MTGTDMVHVPYRGAGPAVQDLIAGNIQLMFDSIPSSAAAVRDGLLRPLAVTTATRAAAYPDLPTIAEAGVPGFDIATWYAIWAPPRTPAPIVARLQRAVAAAVAVPEVRERLAIAGGRPGGRYPGGIRRLLRAANMPAGASWCGTAHSEARLMRAVVCETWREFDALEVKDIPPPPLRPGGVRIRVDAAGVSFATQLVVAGKYQRKPPLPFTPGTEIAGTVLESAPDVADPLPPGTRVFAVLDWGGMAEEAVADAIHVTAIPDGLPLEAAVAHADQLPDRRRPR